MNYALGDIVEVSLSANILNGLQGEVVAFPMKHGDQTYKYGIELLGCPTGILGFNADQLILIERWSERQKGRRKSDE